LYGTTSWVNINILIVLLTFMLFALFYSLSGMFPGSTRERIKQAAKSEATQGVISIFIILVLIGVATTACSISTSMSQSLAKTGMNPFQYSEYYIGNLSTNTGLVLLTNVYSTSVSYAIEAQVLQSIGSILNTGLSSVIKAFVTNLGLSSIVTIGIAPVLEIYQVFAILSTVYLVVIAPLITLVVGVLFIQFLLLPVLQYTAFTIVLPIAIALRSLAFMGTNLKGASNTVLAIAIAGYIVYPLMVSFNSYIISYTFAACSSTAAATATCNPAAAYLKGTYSLPKLTVSQIFSASVANNGVNVPTSISSFFSQLLQGGLLKPIITDASGNTGLISPFAVVSNAQATVNNVAQFIFAGVVLFMIDIAVTLGFAMGLARALNGGIMGAGSFWGGI